MKKTTFILFLVLLYDYGFPQEQKGEMLGLHPFFKIKCGISSIDIKDSTFYFLSENLASVYLVNAKNTLKEPVRKAFPGMEMDKDDLEGLCISGDFVFYTNEKSKGENKKRNVNWIHCYNLKKGEPEDVRVKGVHFPKNDCDNNRGLEGIEINEGKRLMYVLLEKDTNEKHKNEYARIYVFNYIRNGNSTTLKLKSDLHNGGVVKIGPMRKFRYSDLVLHDNQLFLLRSSYELKQYFIDRINLNYSNGIPEKISYSYDEIMFKSLKDEIKIAEKEDYSSNIEGITYFNGDFYIVSDNEFGPRQDGKTLLLKISAD